MSREPGLLLKHLAGGYSLGRSFWIHTVLIGWLVSTLITYLSGELVAKHPARYASMAAIVTTPLAMLLWVWSNTGTFLSALRRLLRGDGWFWSLVAMLMIGLGTQQALPHLKSLVPFLSEHMKVALGAQPGEAFTVKLVDSGRTVEFTGGVNDGAARALRDIIAPAPKVTTVRLSSPGGWMEEGKKMAEVIQYFRLSTHVSGSCMSACTIAFLAGLDRTVSPGAVLGFHSGRPIGGPLANSARDVQRESAIYLGAGVAPAFVERVMKTPPQDMWFPTRRELLQSGVLTR